MCTPFFHNIFPPLATSVHLSRQASTHTLDTTNGLRRVMRGLCSGVSYCVLEAFERGELRLIRLRDPWAGEQEHGTVAVTRQNNGDRVATSKCCRAMIVFLAFAPNCLRQNISCAYHGVRSATWRSNVKASTSAASTRNPADNTGLARETLHITT